MEPKEGIKLEKEFLDKAVHLIEDEKDAKFYKNKRKAFEAAEKLADDDEKSTILWGQYGMIRNQVVFLLFRTKKLTKEIEDEFRDLTPLEVIAEAIGIFDKQHKEEEDEFKEIARKQYKEEQKREIFKAVCNGMSEKEANAKLKAYEDQVMKSVGQA